MTQKSKPQASLTNKISNDFLFIKRFHFRTSLPTQTVVDNLMALNDAQAGDRVKTSKFVVKVWQTSEGYQFEVLSGSLKDDKYGLVYGGGQITSYADSTVVEGSIRFGALIFGLVLFAFVWNVFFLQFPMPDLWYWFSLGWTLLAVVGGFFGLMRERNLLFDALVDSLTPPESTQETVSRLSDAQSDAANSVHENPSRKSRYDQQ